MPYFCCNFLEIWSELTCDPPPPTTTKCEKFLPFFSLGREWGLITGYWKICINSWSNSLDVYKWQTARLLISQWRCLTSQVNHILSFKKLRIYLLVIIPNFGKDNSQNGGLQFLHPSSLKQHMVQDSETDANVRVNSNCDHPPPPPPRANPRAFDFFENLWSNARLCGQKTRPNAPPVRLHSVQFAILQTRNFLIVPSKTRQKFTIFRFQVYYLLSNARLCGAELESNARGKPGEGVIAVGIDSYITGRAWRLHDQ